MPTGCRRALEEAIRSAETPVSAASNLPTEPHDPRIALFGGNAAGFASRDPELLLTGPAGSGKTLSNLLKVYWFARKYPRTRILICRKTRESLTNTVLVTWERDVLGPAHPILTTNPNMRKVRQSYTFANGSEVVVGGIDRPDKILSAEYEIIYVPEATELGLTDWETLCGRLRPGVAPYQQIIADCNPTTPTHFLYRRGTESIDGSPILKMVPTTHKDNPRYWDRTLQKWTADGERYLNRLKRSMTGARVARFLHGVWAAAEGLAFSNWDDSRHIIDRFDPPAHWSRYLSIDWGYTNPCAIQLWVEDPDGRMYLYREIYKSRTLVEEHAKMTVDVLLEGQRRPRAVIGDHSASDRATFERHTGLRVTLADKMRTASDDTAGVQDVDGRLVDAGDGRPRLFIMRDARIHDADAELQSDAKPTCTAEEIPGYIWDPAAKKGERPLKKDDHGCDACRYVIRYVDANKRRSATSAGPGHANDTVFSHLKASGTFD